MPDLKRAIVDHIPVAWLEPDPSPSSSPRPLVIWLPGFSGTKEGTEHQLRDLAAAGFVALSFDAWQHGERRVESNEQLVVRILSNIRRHFWPILAHTAEETSRVIDWAISELNVLPTIQMGGVSMGGDIAVAAAGLDHRIASVAACIATPDWLRPGSHEPPGEPDRYAQACYDRCNPLTHLERYAHAPAITFQCAERDMQVPPDGAQRFAEALKPAYAGASDRINVTLQPDTYHLFTGAMWANSLNWFTRFAAPAPRR